MDANAATSWLSHKLLQAGYTADHLRLAEASRLLQRPQEALARIREVLALLNSRNTAIRQMAVAALSRIGAPAGIGGLAAALAAGQPPSVRVAAAQALAQSGAGAAPATAALCQCLNDPDAVVRWSAQQALGRIGSGAIPALRQMLQSPDMAARSAAALALGSAGADPAVAGQLSDELRRVAAGSPPDVQAACYAGAMKLGAQPGDAQKLAALLQADNAALRSAAVNAVGEMGPAGKAMEEIVLGRCGDPSPAVRAAAAQSLSRLAPDAARTSQTLARLLNDPQAEVRGAAGVSLNMIPQPARQAMDAIRSAAASGRDPRASALCVSALYRSSQSVMPQ